MIKKYAVFLLGCLVALFTPYVCNAENIKNSENVSVKMFTDGNGDFIAHFSINEGWHIYWSNPGEIGKPTEIKAQANNLQILNQSAPLYHKAYDIMDEYIYKNSAFFHFKLNPIVANNKIEVIYTECNDVCISEKLIFNADLIEKSSLEKWNEIKEKAEHSFPTKIKLRSPIDGNSVWFEANETDNIRFVPNKREIIKDEIITKGIENNGIRVSWQTLENNILSEALIMTPQNSFIAEIEYIEEPKHSLFYILLLAFLGGIIINAMPCVFPVLSIKILSIIRHSNGEKRYSNALLYSLGVICSFMILTTIIVYLKQQGESLGWGFQLQSPWFVAAMALLFLAMFLFMIDAVPFPMVSSNLLSKLNKLDSFGTGFFAVLIASPCTGPFMGVAIGYAFMRETSEVYAVFMALAIGCALPFALIELCPHAISKILPKPGKWMRNVEVALSIPVLLTSLWLFSILATQLSFRNTENNSALNWLNYDADKIAELANNNEKIFIDFTADWCLTCKFNEKVILNSDKFINFVKDNNVFLFKADLTEENSEISNALSSYGRDGIPVYVYYEDGKYKILPLFFNVKDLVKD